MNDEMNLIEQTYYTYRLYLILIFNRVSLYYTIHISYHVTFTFLSLAKNVRGQQEDYRTSSLGLQLQL